MAALFTFPREVLVKDGRRVCQRPVRELDEKKHLAETASGHLERDGEQTYEADITGIRGNAFRAILGRRADP